MSRILLERGFPGYGIGQRPDKFYSPDEPEFQGAELRAGFMINYHMYRNYWPLTALGKYRTSLNGEAVGNQRQRSTAKQKQAMSE